MAHTEGIGQLPCYILNQYTKPATSYPPFGPELIHHIHGHLNRDGKREPHVAAGSAENLRIDANHLTIQIKQGTT